MIGSHQRQTTYLTVIGLYAPKHLSLHIHVKFPAFMTYNPLRMRE